MLQENSKKNFKLSGIVWGVFASAKGLMVYCSGYEDQSGCSGVIGFFWPLVVVPCAYLGYFLFKQFLTFSNKDQGFKYYFVHFVNFATIVLLAFFAFNIAGFDVLKIDNLKMIFSSERNY